MISTKYINEYESEKRNSLKKYNEKIILFKHKSHEKKTVPIIWFYALQ